MAAEVHLRVRNFDQPSPKTNFRPRRVVEIVEITLIRSLELRAPHGTVLLKGGKVIGRSRAALASPSTGASQSPLIAALHTHTPIYDNLLAGSGRGGRGPVLRAEP